MPRIETIRLNTTRSDRENRVLVGDNHCGWIGIGSGTAVIVTTPSQNENRDQQPCPDAETYRWAISAPGLINVGRASVMDYDALAELLANGHLSGAVIDVFDDEPLSPDSPLWSAPNFVVTPHVSADDGDNYVPITLDLFFANMQRYIADETLINIVRPELGY